MTVIKIEMDAERRGVPIGTFVKAKLEMRVPGSGSALRATVRRACKELEVAMLAEGDRWLSQTERET